MIQDVSLYDRFSYSGEEGLGMYVGYKAGTVSMDDLLRYVKRHVISRVRHCYVRRVRKDICEDLIQSALVELWQLFASKREVPSQNVAVFHSYLNTVIHRRMAREFATVYDDAPKRLDPVEYSDCQCRRIPSTSAPEDVEFMTEVGEAILARVLERLRPMPPLMREAVVFISIEILRYRDKVSEEYLRRRYMIEDPEFVVQHVLTLVRAELYSMRENDVTFATTTERRNVLHEGLEEYFGL
jgi:DNA-directed RNA polymerase specialized sigma24 family protein